MLSSGPAACECPILGGRFLEVQPGVGGRACLLTAWGFFVFQIAEPEACEQMYQSLARIHSNYYKHKVSGPQSFISPAL